MKRYMLALLLFTVPVFCAAQKEESMDVVIKGAKMDQLVNKLWFDLPLTCAIPNNATVESGSTDDCAGIVLKHFRQVANGCKLKDAFKAAIKLEFKLLKLIPVGKLAGTLLDIADLTSKALSAKSPEELEADLLKYGFGKVVGDQVVKKLKDLTSVPAGEAGDVLGNLTKLFYKQLWDKAKAEIFPKAEKMQCNDKSLDCEFNIHISVEPVAEEGNVIARMIFSANGDCHCKVACKLGAEYQRLKDWNLKGEMDIRIEKAEVVETGTFFKAKVLQVTLGPGNPTYRVSANCNCTHSSNIPSDNPNTFFVGLGLINEDAYADRFNNIGGNVAYIHALASRLGLTGYLGAYFGSHNGVKYTKIQLLAGLSYFASTAGKFIFTPHVLAGVANINSKSMVGNAKSTSLSAVVGADVGTQLKNKMGVVLRAGYNPAFPAGGIVHNFRVAAGIQLR